MAARRSWCSDRAPREASLLAILTVEVLLQSPSVPVLVQEALDP